MTPTIPTPPIAQPDSSLPRAIVIRHSDFVIASLRHQSALQIRPRSTNRSHTAGII
jgi:hypothetical protein